MNALTRALTLFALVTCFAGVAPAIAPQSSHASLAPSHHADYPPDVLVSADQQAVFVFDAGEQSGGAYSICVYYGGKLVTTLAPEQFLTPDEVANLPRCRCPKNHRAWRHLFDFSVQGQVLYMTRVGGDRTTTLIVAETGGVSQVRVRIPG